MFNFKKRRDEVILHALLEDLDIAIVKSRKLVPLVNNEKLSLPDFDGYDTGHGGELDDELNNNDWNEDKDADYMFALHDYLGTHSQRYKELNFVYSVTLRNISNKIKDLSDLEHTKRIGKMISKLQYMLEDTCVVNSYYYDEPMEIEVIKHLEVELKRLRQVITN